MPNYNDLINIEEFGEKKESFTEERGEVSFYCKDCKEIVETERLNPNKYEYKCKKCSGKNIVIGTLEGLKSNYRIK
ncbi:MAG: hypothetical protein PHR68_02300 [Candidatus Gracilibacteria bacterium]|nr:hypothetical protein [Candidatus Gracilibacteria bacterium]